MKPHIGNEYVLVRGSRAWEIVRLHGVVLGERILIPIKDPTPVCISHTALDKHQKYQYEEYIITKLPTYTELGRLHLVRIVSYEP